MYFIVTLCSRIPKCRSLGYRESKKQFCSISRLISIDFILKKFLILSIDGISAYCVSGTVLKHFM